MKVSPFTPGSDQQGSAPNPSDDDYRRKFDEGNFEERLKDTPSQDDVAKGLDDLEKHANGDNARSSRPIDERESMGDHSIPTTFSGKNNKTNMVAKFTFKKAAPFLGGGGIIGIIIFLIGGWLPTMLIPGLAQGSIAENDSRSTVLERRLLAKLKTKMADTSGPCATKSAICLNKKMPKNMLDSMAKHGIVPGEGAGDSFKAIDTKGTGYVDKNPTHYQFTDSSGKLKTVAAEDFLNEYKNNPVFRKTFKKAWNMRYVSYASNFMRKALGKWGVKPDGGKAADSGFDEKTAPTKTAEATKAGGDKLTEGGAKDTFKGRAKTLLNRAADKIKKSQGDPVITIGSGVCMAVGMPTFIAGTIRAVQLAQVMVLASDFILSAGDMIRSGDAKPEQTAALGNTLQARYQDPETNTMKAAVDSPILLAAAGAATQSILKPNDRMPGYALFSNKSIQNAGMINDALKEPCKLINSPQAMVVSATATGAIAGFIGPGTALAAAKLALQGLGKALIALGGITLIMEGLEKAGVMDWIGGMAFDAAKGLIGNQYDDAKGIQLGDALGAGIFAALSIGALSGGAAVLTKSQAGSFSKIMGSVDNEYKQEDIATLSPLDVSSRYTFLGSIVSKLAVSSAGSSNIMTSALSTISTIIKSPLQIFGNPASAAVDPVEAKFGYASYYGVNNDIAVTVAGTPATGIPTEYLDMDTTQAENLVADSFDPTTGAPYEPSATLDVEGTFSGKNADITTTIADCAGADLESMSGCTITSMQGGESAEKLAAERNYYMDYGLERVLNGEDAADGNGGDTAQGLVGKPDGAIDSDRGWILADGVDYSKYPCDPRTTDAGVYTNPDRGFTVRLCTVNFNGGGTIASVISTNAMNMFEAARSAGVELGISDGMRRATDADYSSYTIHKYGTAMDLGTPSAGNTICYGGDPRYGYGSKENAEAACRARGGIHYQAYQWLQANAAKYGFFNYEVEPWHWSSSGG